jgi:23S rRNA pseudouridine1911/1915/1917 synthase
MPVPERSEEVTVAAEERGARLDRVLAAYLAELSRSRHKALILAGHVAVDAAIRDPSYRANAGTRIRLTVSSRGGRRRRA